MIFRHPRDLRDDEILNLVLRLYHYEHKLYNYPIFVDDKITSTYITKFWAPDSIQDLTRLLSARYLDRFNIKNDA